MAMITPDTSAEARDAAFLALQGHPMIMSAVVHAFAIVFAELDALRAPAPATAAVATAAASPEDVVSPVTVDPA